jgi:hypothetical protein
MALLSVYNGNKLECLKDQKYAENREIKLLPTCILSFGLFPGVCSLNANVSEHSVCSIFMGEKV